MKSKTMWLGLGALALSSAVAGSAYAGMKLEYGDCIKNKDGSGYCYGTFRGWRNALDANQSVHFGGSYLAGDKGVQFNWHGQALVCMVPAGSPLESWWPSTILNATGSFAVNWNAQGQCTHVYLGNSSAYREY